MGDGCARAGFGAVPTCPHCPRLARGSALCSGRFARAPGVRLSRPLPRLDPGTAAPWGGIPGRQQDGHTDMGETEAEQGCTSAPPPETLSPISAVPEHSGGLWVLPAPWGHPDRTAPSSLLPRSKPPAPPSSKALLGAGGWGPGGGTLLSPGHGGPTDPTLCWQRVPFRCRPCPSCRQEGEGGRKGVRTPPPGTEAGQPGAPQGAVHRGLRVLRAPAGGRPAARPHAVNRVPGHRGHPAAPGRPCMRQR